MTVKYLGRELHFTNVCGWLISMLSAAAFAAHAIWPLFLIHQQRRAISTVDAIGGRVDFRPGGPAWLRSWLRDERLRIFDVPDIVYLDHTPFGDEQMVSLARLKDLKGVNLKGTLVTDLGLSQIETLRDLHYLELDATGITDDGLAHLERLPNLEFLFLNDLPISDAGIIHLKKLPHLRQLHLANCAVTAAGIADLKQSLPDLDVRTN
jgi:hypothetical protein